MPFGDGTGPQGMGSMTGRGVGYCTGFGLTGFAGTMLRRGRFGFNRGFGRSFGHGRGRGKIRRGFNPFISYSRW